MVSDYPYGHSLPRMSLNLFLFDCTFFPIKWVRVINLHPLVQPQ